MQQAIAVVVASITLFAGLSIPSKTLSYQAEEEPPPICLLQTGVIEPVEVANPNCSCVQTVRSKVPDLPKGNAVDFIPNSNMKDGNVLILKYGEVTHIAYKEEIVFEGIVVYEGNFDKCVVGNRLITWGELTEHLIGFYKVVQ